MEGLLFLLLMFWLFKSVQKKSKKKSANGIQSKIRSGVQNAIRTMESAQVPQAQRQSVVEDTATESLEEGQSYMQMTMDAHGHLSDREEYMGSMAADTSEGKDMCDLSLDHEGLEEKSGVYEGEIGSEPAFDLSPRAICQGFVMSEILKRPSGYRSVRR